MGGRFFSRGDLWPANLCGEMVKFKKLLKSI